MSPVIFNIYFIFTFSFKFLTSLYFLAIQCQKELQNVNVKKPCMDVYNPAHGRRWPSTTTSFFILQVLLPSSDIDTMQCLVAELFY